MQYTHLKKYGLLDSFAQEATLHDGLFLARVTAQHRDSYKVMSEQGELSANVSGKLAHDAENHSSFPAVGDWVMLDRMHDHAGNATIHHILQRKSIFTRQAAGTANELQVIAANIDTVFICMSLNADFNLRRMERYLTLVWDSTAKAVIVLTKSDLCNELQHKIDEISSISMGADVVFCSTKNKEGHATNDGYAAIEPYIEKSKTIAFIGSSGVGKSTLINRLMGYEVLATQEIREEDDKGKHTTTHRELFLLPSGGIVIDTPGMREQQLNTGNIAQSFEDIEELTTECKYSDCSHTTEPGCMILHAITTGTLSKARFDNYQKLQKELLKKNIYEGLNSRQVAQKKITTMFGGKKEMKQIRKHSKNKMNSY